MKKKTVMIMCAVFTMLTPYISVITATDPDHLDIYGTKEAYLESFRKYKKLIKSVH